MTVSPEEVPDLGAFFGDAIEGIEPDLALEEAPRLKLEQVCIMCRQGHHDECDAFWAALDAARTSGDEITWEMCCCGGDFDVTDAIKRESSTASSTAARSYVDGYDESADDQKPSAYFDGFTGTKDLSSYVDANSSGRKMAAKMAPIKRGLVCEWAWLQNAGGGIIPIVGCPGRPASDRHHGPDKNTLHNVLGTNLHRICDWCHAQWHAKNDIFYGARALKPDGTVDGSVPFLPIMGGECKEHDPITRATDEEVYKQDAIRRAEARAHGAKI